MGKGISLQELIAINSTPKARALVVKYGFRPARSTDDLIKKLYRITKENKKDALQDLIAIHPHSDLFSWKAEQEEMSNVCGGCGVLSGVDGVKSSGCGCKACEDKHSNMVVDDVYVDVEGKEAGKGVKNPLNAETVVNKTSEYLPLVVVATVFAITLSYLSKQNA